MGRFYDEKAIYTFLDFIKTSFPESFIRTNFIIGFPEETEEDVQKLHSFIEKEYFDNIALFEYHDEPLAASSKLPNKIPEKLIHQRFLPLRRLVNIVLLKKQQARKGKQETGYVQEIHKKKNQTIFFVRPQLHCPEIDEGDEITENQIISCENAEIQIADKITYIV
jgi:ribosomal protein S12 methylthiotransferase